MINDQTLEGRRENLSQANKLSRTFATLVGTLNHYQGKGQQKVTVEHAMFTVVARPLSAVLNTPAGGGQVNRRNNPTHKPKLPMHASPRCGVRTRSGNPCRSSAMPNGRCRMHGGPSPGAPKANRNALNHGRYTAEAIARRRKIASLICAVREIQK